jgi:CRISPR-associated endonuclease/helicase Cas3
VDAKESAAFSAAFFARMVFSALVDADRLATEEFYNKAEGKATERGFPDVTLEDLKVRLDAALIEKMRSAPSSPVNTARAEILASVRARAADPQGIFTLTVPTGGGKTLATLAFALEHAVENHLDRVIVVIPYTSVVEQTAEAYREALGDLGCCVLEHHGAFDDTKLRTAADEPEMRDKLRQAQENWDAPIIVTTAVQLFESLFHNKTSRCRKLHQISRAVVVLDEVQTLPLQVLRPAIWALDELARNYRTSLVLSTATQPAVLETGDAERSFAGGLSHARELMPDPARLFQILKRVEVKLIAGKLDDEALAHEIEQREQILTILNTRRHARELFGRIKAAGGARHLSTMMCAAHRSEVLAGIRADLKDGKPARVVATSLIEAGVDIDFPCVFRAEAGLDQIAQAAGRCNREGRGDPAQSAVYVFEIAGDRTHVEMSQRWSATKEVWRKLERGEIAGSLLDPPAIEAYFRQVYWQKGHEELDKYGILACLGRAAKPLRLPMETIARKFKMIDSPMVPVLIGWDYQARRAIEALCYADRVGGIARRLQRYLVNIPARDRAALIGRGAAEVIRPDQFGEQFVVLRDMDLYRDDVGLDGSDPTFMEAGSQVC